MSADESDDEISLLDLLHTVVDNLRLLVGGSLGAGLIALGIAFVIPPTFTAKTQFLPPQQAQSAASALLQNLGAMGGLAGAAAGLKNPSDQYIAFLKSDGLLDQMIERFELMKRYDKAYREDARKELSERTRISSGKDGLIKLEVDDAQPQLAADMANAYVEELRRLMSRLAVTEAQQRRAFFDTKMQEAKVDLTRADQALRATGVSANTLKSSPVTAVEVVAKLKGAISAQEVKIGSMRGYLAESSPEVKQALVELSSLKTQLAKAEQTELASTAKSEDTYLDRFREYKYRETLYDMFAKQYELARVDEAREGAVIQVVDAAVAPEKKSKPKRALIAVVTTIAVGFALLLFVFIRQALRNAEGDDETRSKLNALQASWKRALGKG